MPHEPGPAPPSLFLPGAFYGNSSGVYPSWSPWRWPVSVDRIVSLVPAATETLFALGLGERIQAVSHACDHPEEANSLPRATRLRVDTEGTSQAIDEAVRAAVDAGEPMYEVLGDVLHHVQPDLVVTQEACEVCGITPVDVKATLSRFEPVDRPEILTLHPHTLEDVLEDVRRLAKAAGEPQRGHELAKRLAERVQAVERLAERSQTRPSVAALDWLDPPMAAGHWVPDMVEIAGGRPLLLQPGAPSAYVDWENVCKADPEVLLLAPCGFDTDRATREARTLRDRDGWKELSAVRSDRVYALDADAYTSRPGPRLVDGLEQLACAIQGERAVERYGGQAARIEPVPA